VPVTYFSSGDAGTNKTGYAGIKGVVGDLIKVLNSTLILDTGFTETGASSFSDATNSWIQMGAGTALFVANNATTDRAYVGGRQKFSQIIAKFATAGVGGTCTFEYWNGSAWTAFSPTDGTSALTADGTISWSASSLSGWAQTTVNSVTLYWVRIKWATTYSTNPVAKLLSIYGWGSPFQGTNGASYRSQLTSGVQHYVTVNDNGPNNAQEAQAYAAEALTQYNTTQQTDGSNGVTKPFPTTTQGVSGNTGVVVWRKSADTTTARTWRVAMDEKTFYLFIITGDATANYAGAPGFGEYFSLTAGDLYRSFISGRLTNASTTITGASGLNPLCHRQGGNSTWSTQTGACTYIPRTYTGTGSSILVSILNGLSTAIAGTTTGTFGTGTIATFNGADAGLFMAQPSILDIAVSNTIRGRLRGLWDWGHAAAALNDQDTFGGSGALAAKTFVAIKDIRGFDTNSGASPAGMLIVETSNTWETN
jgi:hypothetical protein